MMKRLVISAVWCAVALASALFTPGCHSGDPTTAADSGVAAAADSSVADSTGADSSVTDAASADSTGAVDAEQDCIVQYCSVQTMACIGDSDCTSQLSCIMDCESVVDDPDAYNRCTLRCNLLLVPSSPVFDAMMGCVLEHGCGPEAPNLCSVIGNPDSLHDLTPEQLEGNWFNVRGYNLGTDCFDCSYSTFTQGDYSSESRTTIWKIDWLMDDLGMRYIEGELEVGGADHPGLAVFRYDFIGAQFVEYYNMVFFDDDQGNEVLVFVGCGGSDTASSQVGYSIGMVLTRQQRSELDVQLVEEINTSLLAIGLDPPLERMDVSDWCSNGYQLCPASE